MFSSMIHAGPDNRCRCLFRRTGRRDHAKGSRINLILALAAFWDRLCRGNGSRLDPALPAVIACDNAARNDRCLLGSPPAINSKWRPRSGMAGTQSIPDVSPAGKPSPSYLRSASSTECDCAMSLSSAAQLRKHCERASQASRRPQGGSVTTTLRVGNAEVT
jgi:hypothetical protein